MEISSIYISVLANDYLDDDTYANITINLPANTVQGKIALVKTLYLSHDDFVLLYVYHQLIVSFLITISKLSCMLITFFTKFAIPVT